MKRKTLVPKKLSKQDHFEIQEIEQEMGKLLSELVLLSAKKSKILSKLEDSTAEQEMKALGKEVQKLKAENDAIKSTLRNLLSV